MNQMNQIHMSKFPYVEKMTHDSDNFTIHNNFVHVVDVDSDV